MKNDQEIPPADGTLTRASLSGGFWSTVNTVATKSLGAAKTIILARLLFPEDFGLIGLALVIVGTVSRFSYPGIYTALIQKQELHWRDLSTGWWIHAFRGAALFLVVFPFAGTIAEFYEEPQLKLILQVISLTFLLEGIQSIGLVRLNRNLDFRRLMWVHQTANIVSFVVVIALAWQWRNVWALVVGHIVQLTTVTVMSYVIEPFRPTFRLDWARTKELMHFGRYVFFAGICYHLIVRGNEFILGKIVGIEIYGYYALALTLVGTIANLSEQLTTVVAFPLMSRLQHAPERLANAYLRVFRMAVLLTVPVFLGLAIFGRDVIALVLGSRWMPMLHPLIWLCMFQLFHCLGLTLQSLYTALGEVAPLARLRFVQLVLYLVGILPSAVYYGSAGAAFWLFVVAALTFFLLLKRATREVTELSSRVAGVVVSYWPLFLIQGIFALWQAGIPSSWLKVLILGSLYTVSRQRKWDTLGPRVKRELEGLRG